MIVLQILSNVQIMSTQVETTANVQFLPKKIIPISPNRKRISDFFKDRISFIIFLKSNLLPFQLHVIRAIFTKVLRTIFGNKTYKIVTLMALKVPSYVLTALIRILVTAFMRVGCGSPGNPFGTGNVNYYVYINVIGYICIQ